MHQCKINNPYRAVIYLYKIVFSILSNSGKDGGKNHIDTSPTGKEETSHQGSGPTQSHRVLIMGNSHFKNVNTENFIYDYITDKCSVYTFDEAKSRKIQKN